MRDSWLGDMLQTPDSMVADEPVYLSLGGAVDRLVNAFYAQMDSRSDSRGIRAMHEPDLGHTQAVLRLYLAEWLGERGYDPERVYSDAGYARRQTLSTASWYFM